jgi:sugar lactone lactonase YvrE
MMSTETGAAAAPQVLVTGLAYPESPRWHNGRLWFAHWGTGEIVATDLAGVTAVVGEGPTGLGWSLGWLSDGQLLVTGDRLMRHGPDGSAVPHADLRAVGSHGWNEIVVDGRDNIYVNGFDFAAPDEGVIAMVSAEGQVRKVAEGLAFPNGMVVTPDNKTLIVAESFAGRLTAFDIKSDGSLSGRRTWADGVGPDGICLDRSGAIWTHAADVEAQADLGPGPHGACVLVREGGEVVKRVNTDQAGFACALGGPDGNTLFLLVADWLGFERIDEALANRTGKVLQLPV